MNYATTMKKPSVVSSQYLSLRVLPVFVSMNKMMSITIMTTMMIIIMFPVAQAFCYHPNESGGVASRYYSYSHRHHQQHQQQQQQDKLYDWQMMNGIGQSSFSPSASPTALRGMKRPILDKVASALFKLENARVEASSEQDEKGRVGEPMEWSDSTSLANQFSEAVASNTWGYQFKQFVADIVAGDYDEGATNAKIDAFLDIDSDSDVAVRMFSFSTCPFCRRAKDFLDDKGVPYNAMELDELEGNQGNAIRAILGKRTQRTSVPSIFIRGQYIGGCNDGPGLLPLAESGELDKLLQKQA